MAFSCVMWLIFNGGCQTSALKPVFAVQPSLDRLLAWGARTPNDMPQRRTETKQSMAPVSCISGRRPHSHLMTPNYK
jgi:hypothetical protein